MKNILPILAMLIVMVLCSCASQKRGYDYEAHYKRNKKLNKEVTDLTRYRCGKERR